MGFRDNTSGDGATGGFERNEDYKKIIPSSKSGIEIPEIGKGRLYFRLLDGSSDAWGHYMEFWLNLGLNSQTQEPILIPKVSPNKFSDFLAVGRNGKKYVGRTATAFGCPLSKLADMRHPLIALNHLKKDKDNQLKPSVDPCHVTLVQLVRPVKDATGKVILENGVPKVEVLPEVWILKLRQGWWDQFLNIIEPKETSLDSADDGMTETAPQVVKTLPTKDLTKIVWFLEKRVRTINPTGNAKMDVDYVLSFSEKAVLAPGMIPEPTGMLDFRKVMQAPTDQELAELVIKAEVRSGMRPSAGQAPAPFAGTGGGAPSPDKPESWGEKVPRPQAPAPALAAAGAPAGAPSTGGNEEDVF